MSFAKRARLQSTCVMLIPGKKTGQRYNKYHNTYVVIRVVCVCECFLTHVTFQFVQDDRDTIHSLTHGYGFFFYNLLFSRHRPIGNRYCTRGHWTVRCDVLVCDRSTSNVPSLDTSKRKRKKDHVRLTIYHIRCGVGGVVTR